MRLDSHVNFFYCCCYQILYASSFLIHSSRYAILFYIDIWFNNFFILFAVENLTGSNFFSYSQITIFFLFHFKDSHWTIRGRYCVIVLSGFLGVFVGCDLVVSFGWYLMSIQTYILLYIWLVFFSRFVERRGDNYIIWCIWYAEE